MGRTGFKHLNSDGVIDIVAAEIVESRDEGKDDPLFLGSSV